MVESEGKLLSSVGARWQYRYDGARYFSVSPLFGKWYF